MLFASMAALWRLSRYQELTVARASGLSVWHLLLPGLAVAFTLGVVKVIAFNPLAAASLAIFEDMEVRHFNKRPNNPLLSGKGLWLKDYSGDYDLVIHGKAVDSSDRLLRGVTVFQFQDRDQFNARLDAETARLSGGEWRLQNVRIVRPGSAGSHADNVTLATKLDWTSMVENVSNPRSMPIWKLPGFIEKIEAAGFSASAHRVHFHSTAASPLLLCAMVVIAAGFAIRPPRRGGLFALVSMCALAGIAFYIVSQIFLRLGQSGQIPAILAAWAPTACVLMLGATWLLYTEDG
jgi:lipopolysaccharide export system permease protein